MVVNINSVVLEITVTKVAVQLPSLSFLVAAVTNLHFSKIVSRYVSA